MYSPEEGSCEFISTSSLRRQRGHVAVHAVCPFEARGSAAGSAVSSSQRSRGGRTEPTTPQLGKTELFGHRAGCFALSEMHRSWRSVRLSDRRMEESGPPGSGARRFRSLGISIMRRQSSRQLERQRGARDVRTRSTTVSGKSYGGSLGKSAGGSPEPAAGAGGQKPPRRSGAKAEGPPAVGAVVPATPGRAAPLFQGNRKGVV